MVANPKGFYTAALKEAKLQRKQSKTLLKNIQGILAKRGDEASQRAREGIETTLTKIARDAGADAEQLALQLDSVLAVFRDDAIAALAKGRGGDKLIANVNKAVGALRGTSTARDARPGTPAHTEQMDLLDGLIVDACRAARAAARSADEALGQSSLAKEFRLRHLEPSNNNEKPS